MGLLGGEVGLEKHTKKRLVPPDLIMVLFINYPPSSLSIKMILIFENNNVMNLSHYQSAQEIIACQLRMEPNDACICKIVVKISHQKCTVCCINFDSTNVYKSIDTLSVTRQYVSLLVHVKALHIFNKHVPNNISMSRQLFIHNSSH